MAKKARVWDGTNWQELATAQTDLTGYANLSTNQPSFRNVLINGGFSIDQRNGGANQAINKTAPLAYTVDRWYAYCEGGAVNAARVAGAAPSQYYYRFTGDASNTLIGFGQRIEAANSFHLAGQPVTLSVNLASTSLTSITWTAYYANTTDTFGSLASPTRTQIATGTLAVTSTLGRKSATFTVPSAATTGIEIVFTTGALLGSQTLTFDDAQLELGTVATPFEQRPIGLELDLCHRYYRRWTNNGAYVQYYGLGLGSAQSNALASVFVQTKMRTAAATLESSNVAVFRVASAVVSGGTLSLVNATSDGVEVRYTGTAGQFNVGETITFVNNNAASSFIGIGAEL
jgi:hypothetical protein